MSASSAPLNSLTRILPLGAAVASLPLLVALAVITLRLGNFAERSRVITEQAVIVTRGLQQMSMHLREMERGASQFEVLQTADLIDKVTRHHHGFQEGLARLEKLEFVGPMRDSLGQLAVGETAAFAQINVAVKARSSLVTSIDQLAATHARLNACREETIELTDAKSAALKSETDTLRRWAAITIALSLLIAAVLTAWFATLFSRLVRQFSGVISRLGRGAYDEPVQFGGPPDIIAVGDQLDWLRQRLKAIENQQTTFLTHVSHELKTPLSALREGTAILADGITGVLNPEQRRVVRILESNVDRLQARIGTLVETQRIANEHLALRPVNCALDKLLREVLSDHSLAIKARDLTLVGELCGAPYFGDDEKLRIAVINLIDNAIKYSPCGGLLKVDLVSNDECWVIDIVDQGPGIARTEYERVFQPFNTRANQPTDGIKGNGLGLSIARTYVRAHGGDLVVCDCPDGAHLRLQLPANDAAGNSQ